MEEAVQVEMQIGAALGWHEVNWYRLQLLTFGGGL
jgi:hypothetical protein